MKSTLFALVYFTFCTFFGYSQKNNLPVLLEKAGKQKLLCEQVTKSFLWLGLAINNNDAKVEFDDAKFAFSKNLLFFAENSKSANTKIAVQNLIFLWSEFKILLEAKPNKENAMIVINKSNLIMNSCSELISKIYFENNIKNTRILNLCNKQKLNIEKISKYSVIKNWNFGYPELEKDLNEAIVSYEFSLSQLILSEDNSPEITNLLSQRLEEWPDNKPNFVFDNKTISPEKVIVNTNLILKEWNKISLIYQKMAMSNDAFFKL